MSCHHTCSFARLARRESTRVRNKPTRKTYAVPAMFFIVSSPPAELYCTTSSAANAVAAVER
eukprot:1139628-Pelagomonas_calceolata.AAC.2